MQRIPGRYELLTTEGNISGQHVAESSCSVVTNIAVAVEHEDFEGAALVGKKARQREYGRVVQAAPRNRDLSDAMAGDNRTQVLDLQRSDLPRGGW